MIVNVRRSSRKIPVILVSFQRNLNFVDRSAKNTQISIFMKIRLVGAELLHANSRIDMAKLVVALRNFANAPLKLHYSIVHYSFI